MLHLAQAAPDNASLPALRSELQFSTGPLDAKGFPSLIVTDPTRGSYFRLEWPASAIVQEWRAGPVSAALDHLRAAFGLTLSPGVIAGVVDFLAKNELIRIEKPGQWQGLAKRASEERNRNPLLRMVHAYLFFRLPLLRPDRMLTRALTGIGHVFTPLFWVVYAGTVLAGLYLVSRQWDQFVAGTQDLLRLETLPLYATLLLALKLVHESGHALMARHYGCHVPSMGVAVMMGVPVFYTDTTDTWRLPERHKRLMVVMAGVGAEMLVAGLALPVWALAENPTLRQMCVALVSLSLVTSLAINLNPLMRFDGYFALSDLTGITNLQERAFSVTRSHLKSLLFGAPRTPMPDLSARQAAWLTLYGYLTWGYRLALYLGMAAMAYAASFKLMGLALMGFVVVWFILRPLLREGKTWWAERETIAGAPRARFTASLLLALVVLCLLPLNRVVEAPAFLVARDEAPLHVRMPARLAEIHVSQGDLVEAGTLLFQLESPALAAESVRLSAERTVLEARLTRAAAREADRDALQVIQNQLRSIIERQNATERLKQDLRVHAPLSGIVVDMDPMLTPGLWMGANALLARVASPEGSAVRAFVSTLEAERISKDASAAFISESGMAAPVAMRVMDVASSGEALRLEPALAEPHGGPVPVGDDRKGLTPRRGTAHVLLVAAGSAPAIAQRGTIRITATAESLAWRGLRTALSVVTRESGF